jgi:hypothetical protein
MNAELYIDATYNVTTDADGTRQIIMWEHDLELSFTLMIHGSKSIRKRLRYNFKSMSDDPIEMVNKVLVEKRFSFNIDFFAESNHGPGDITDLSIIWDQNNLFLKLLFSVVKQDKLLEVFA